jgi:ParB family chromosome partitioning protein
MAGLVQVPVIIRVGESTESQNDLMKLELAIIENVQREDLNPVERAKAFKKLADEFGFRHHQIAHKIGKSRVYVTNSMRILDLPEDILQALSEGKINEGHTRPLLMLINRPEEQKVLFQDIILKKMNVRDTAYAGILRKTAEEKFYLQTGDGQAVTLFVSVNVNLNKYIGKKIFASGRYNKLDDILYVTDASDLEVLIQSSPIPTLSPTPVSSLTPSL